MLNGQNSFPFCNAKFAPHNFIFFAPNARELVMRLLLTRGKQAHSTTSLHVHVFYVHCQYVTLVESERASALCSCETQSTIVKVLCLISLGDVWNVISKDSSLVGLSWDGNKSWGMEACYVEARAQIYAKLCMDFGPRRVCPLIPALRCHSMQGTILILGGNCDPKHLFWEARQFWVEVITNPSQALRAREAEAQLFAMFPLSRIHPAWGGHKAL